jgi:hypothetical protein
MTQPDWGSGSELGTVRFINFFPPDSDRAGELVESTGEQPVVYQVRLFEVQLRRLAVRPIHEIAKYLHEHFDYSEVVGDSGNQRESKPSLFYFERVARGLRESVAAMKTET